MKNYQGNKFYTAAMIKILKLLKKPAENVGCFLQVSDKSNILKINFKALCKYIQDVRLDMVLKTAELKP